MVNDRNSVDGGVYKEMNEEDCPVSTFKISEFDIEECGKKHQWTGTDINELNAYATRQSPWSWSIKFISHHPSEDNKPIELIALKKQEYNSWCKALRKTSNSQSSKPPASEQPPSKHLGHMWRRLNSLNPGK